MTIRLKYDYRKFPSEPSEAFPRRRSATRPVIPITLINDDQRIGYLAVIDSGADVCLFHAQLGKQIGLDIKSGKKLIITGLTKKPITSYFHNIKIEIGGYQFDCYSGFSSEIGNLPYGLLGQQGFFNLFCVQMDFNKERIELKTRV